METCQTSIFNRGGYFFGTRGWHLAFFCPPLLLDFIIAFFGICYKKKICWFNQQIEVEITVSIICFGLLHLILGSDVKSVATSSSSLDNTIGSLASPLLDIPFLVAVIVMGVWSARIFQHVHVFIFAFQCTHVGCR